MNWIFQKATQMTQEWSLYLSACGELCNPPNWNTWCVFLSEPRGESNDRLFGEEGGRRGLRRAPANASSNGFDGDVNDPGKYVNIALSKERSKFTWHLGLIW